MNEVCAKDFLNLSENDLRNAGLSRPKINYLKGVADQELSGKFDFKDLEKMEDVEAQIYVPVKGHWRLDSRLLFNGMSR